MHFLGDLPLILPCYIVKENIKIIDMARSICGSIATGKITYATKRVMTYAFHTKM
jgi:hypothetical protein